MDISIFLAQVLGLYLVICAAAFLAQPKMMADIIDMYVRKKVTVMMGGMLSLLVGIPLVLLHSIWDGELYQTIISAIAWGALIKGVTRTFLPQTVMKWGKNAKRHSGLLRFATVILLLVGLYLVYIGFGWGV